VFILADASPYQQLIANPNIDLIISHSKQCIYSKREGNEHLPILSSGVW